MLVGEMRDRETIEAALTVAETGHLVLSTLHTGSAVQTLTRIVDVFPPHQQAQMRAQLALVLQAVVAQQLVRRRDGTGRVLAARGAARHPGRPQPRPRREDAPGLLADAGRPVGHRHADDEPCADGARRTWDRSRAGDAVARATEPDEVAAARALLGRRAPRGVDDGARHLASAPPSRHRLRSPLAMRPPGPPPARATEGAGGRPRDSSPSCSVPASPVVHSLRLLVEQAESARATPHAARRRTPWSRPGSTLARRVGRAARRLPAAVRRRWSGPARSGGVLEAVLHRLARASRAVRTPATHRRWGRSPTRRVVVSAGARRHRGAARLGRPRVRGSVRERGSRAARRRPRMVLALSSARSANTLVPLGGAAAGHRRDDRWSAHAATRGRPIRDRWLLRVPGHRSPVPQGRRRPAARTLGTLIACGVAILDALDVAARTAGNRVVEDAFVQARAGLARGRSLAQPLAECPAHPRDGPADDRRRRSDRYARHHARADGGLLRRRGAGSRRHPARPARARPDPLPRRRGRAGS